MTSMSQIKDCSEDQPEERLRRFIQAMEKWETESWQAMKQAERTAKPYSFENLARPQMTAIFHEFCTPKKRIYLGREDLTLAHPSDYCSDKLILTPRQLSPRRAEFVASSSQRGRVTKWVFVMLKQGGRWLVDNKKAINDDGSETAWWL